MISHKNVELFLASEFAADWEKCQNLSHLNDYIEATPSDFYIADFMQDRFSLRATRSEQRKLRTQHLRSTSTSDSAVGRAPVPHAWH